MTLTRLILVSVAFVRVGCAAAVPAEATSPRLAPLSTLSITNQAGERLGLFSMAGLRAEFRHLKKTLRAIDLEAAPVSTDGWTHNIAEAEWPVMACASFGYACANLAEADPSSRAEALEEIRWLLQALQSRRLSGFMTPHFGPPFGSDKIKVAVFVHGHFLNLALRYRALTNDMRSDILVERVANALASAMKQSHHGAVRSYTNMWWISDNFPAYAALARYDRLFGRDTSMLRTNFLRQIREHYLDPTTGLIATYVNADRQQRLQGPRGISTMYGLHFLGEISPALAAEQYNLARRYFVRVGLGLGAVREFPPGIKEQPDIDSGSVFLGLGPSASGFAIGAAALMDDDDTAVALLRAAALIGHRASSVTPYATRLCRQWDRRSYSLVRQ